MKTKSGILIMMTKTEQKEMRLLIEHAKQDLGYGVGGTFGDGENWNKKGEAEKVRLAIKSLEWILSLQN